MSFDIAEREPAGQIFQIRAFLQTVEIEACHAEQGIELL